MVNLRTSHNKVWRCCSWVGSGADSIKHCKLTPIVEIRLAFNDTSVLIKTSFIWETLSGTSSKVPPEWKIKFYTYFSLMLKTRRNPIPLYLSCYIYSQLKMTAVTRIRALGVVLRCFWRRRLTQFNNQEDLTVRILVTSGVCKSIILAQWFEIFCIVFDIKSIPIPTSRNSRDVKYAPGNIIHTCM